MGMINREWQTVSVQTYTDGVDTYGQKRQMGYTSRNIQMVIHLYQQSNVSDPRFVDVELIGLTKDVAVSTDNTITISNVVYDVVLTIPGKYNQVFMKRQL